MPAILDGLFHKAVNTTSIPLGMGGGGWWGATIEVEGTSDPKTSLWPNGFNSGCFQFHTSQNVARSMPSLTSQSYSDSLPAVCLVGQLSWSHLQPGPPEHPWMPDRPMNEASVKADR